MPVECSRFPALGSSIRCVLLLLVTLLAAPAARAQVLYGSLSGNVTDNAGAAIPGANVTITNTETQAVREMVSDESGVYRFTTVQPGPYKVVVTLTGLGTFKPRALPVRPTATTRRASRFPSTIT